MSIARFFVVAGLLALAFGSAAPATQSRITVSPRVTERAAAGEVVHVIIGVDATFVPEGRLSGPAAVATQRVQMRAAVDNARAAVAAAGVVIEPAFDFIPFFPARVTRDSLDRIRQTRGVTSVEEVTISAPSLYLSGPLINAPAAYAAGYDGSGWTVAVLDTGVDSSHPMMAGATTSEACYSSGGVSLCPGGATASTAAGSAQPCSYLITGCDHGTHVAGISIGIRAALASGIAKGAWLIPMQVFSYDPQSGGIGTSSVDWIKGLNRVFALAGPNNANRVASVNMSLGGGNFTSQAQCDVAHAAGKAAIDNLRSIGIATIISSGNDSKTNSMSAPGCISTAISVGSTTKAAPITVSSFSNEAPFLSLLAPGSDIDSAGFFGTYVEKSGTSMAAPHVAGAWAILKQAVPTASVTSVLAALRGTGTPITDTRTGRSYPLINVNAARLALASGSFSTPGVPANFTATASGNTLSLAWAPPPPGTGGTPTSYTLVARPSAGGPVLGTLPLGNVTAFSAAAPNGVFVLSLMATNAVGAGSETPGVAVTLPTVAPPPGSPTNLAAAVAGSTVTFTWNAPASGGPVGNYVLVAGLAPGFAVPAGSMTLSAATTIAVPGIPPGTYYGRVLAQNAGGTSAATNEVAFTVAGASAPGAPTLNAPTVSGRTVGLSWSPGGGGAPTSYVLTALTAGGVVLGNVPLSGASASFSGVPSGSYLLRLVAVNSVGPSPASNTVTLVVP